MSRILVVGNQVIAAALIAALSTIGVEVIPTIPIYCREFDDCDLTALLKPAEPNSTHPWEKLKKRKTGVAKSRRDAKRRKGRK